MCHGCPNALPTTGTRYLQTISTPTGGDEATFCSATCRQAWAGRRQRATALYRGRRPEGRLTVEESPRNRRGTAQGIAEGSAGRVAREPPENHPGIT
jgi:hypothetical protein